MTSTILFPERGSTQWNAQFVACMEAFDGKRPFTYLCVGHSLTMNYNGQPPTVAPEPNWFRHAPEPITR